MYRNLRKQFDDLNVDEKQFGSIVIRIYEVVNEKAVVDWWKNVEHKRRMREAIDDYLYDVVRMEMGIDITPVKMDEIIDIVIDIAQNNHDIFHL